MAHGSRLITATRPAADAGGVLHLTHHPRCLQLLAFTGETHPVQVSTRVGAVCGALAKLASRWRHAVELAYCEALTHTEVEQLTGLPVGTAQLRIRQGLLELRAVTIGR